MAYDTEPYKSPFGDPDDLHKRLAMWAHTLSVDKKYPWVGIGIIDDIKCAAELLTPKGQSLPVYAKPEPASVKTEEYDL